MNHNSLKPPALKSILSKHSVLKMMLTLIILFWGLCINIKAQDIRTSRQSGPYKYIYRISEQEARKIYRNDLWKVNASFFHTLVDSFPTDSSYRKKLPHGHYLYMHARANNIEFELKSVSNIDLKILTNSSDFVIYITDSSGNVVPDAKVEIDEKNVLFDAVTNTYRLKKANCKGFLSVEFQGINSFFYITKQMNNSAFRRTSRKVLYSSPVKYVAIPVRLVASFPMDIFRLAIYQNRSGLIYYVSQPFYDIIHSITWGEPYGCIEKVVNAFSRNESNLKGYIAFNKTVYRLGDTVKWKAYILNGKNKPVSKEMKLSMQNYRNNKNVELGITNPSKPGVYFGEIILADSLNLLLDADYYVKISQDYLYLTERFKLEDYELKSTKYDVRALSTTHYVGEANALFLKGTDENNLNLLDVTADITFTTQAIDNFFEKRVFVADTLWKTTLKLDPVGETRVDIPAGIFSKANISYNATITFLNSSNERVVKGLNLLYRYSEEKLEIDLNNDSVVFRLKRNNKPISKPGTIQLFRNRDLQAAQDVVFPYTCKLNPFITNYSAKTDSLSASLVINQEQSLLECSSERDADSVRFSISNPRKLPVIYYVYHLNKEILRGDETKLSFFLANRSLKNYYLSVHYLWNNLLVSENYEVPLITSKLNITTDQPEYIYPGKTVNIKLKVTDYKNRAVEGADILAYALTAKMPNAKLPAIPSFEEKQKSRELINNFYLKQDQIQNITNTLSLDWKTWNPKMHLDSIRYYRFLYPEKGVFVDSFIISDKTRAMFSPYIVKNGFIQNVFTIYLNGRIVYSNFTNTDIPYVFPAPAGKNEIKVRIPGALITYSDAKFVKGKKYIISLDNDTSNHLAEIQRMSQTLNSWEIIDIQNSLMVIKTANLNNYAYVALSDKVYPLTRKNGYGTDLILGPVNEYNYRFEHPGGYSVVERFEPNFQYEFKKGLVKMYHWNNYNFESKYPIRPLLSFSDSMILESHILNQWRNSLNYRQATTNVFFNPTSTSSGHGRMTLRLATSQQSEYIKNILVFKLNEPGFIRVYAGNADVFHELSKGFYRLLFLSNTNKYLEADSLEIATNGLNLFRISGNWRKPDTLSNRINTIIIRELNKGKFTYFNEDESLKEIKKTYQQSAFTKFNGAFIEGVVRDGSTNEPLIGVNIVEQGSTNGVVSDLEGHYKIPLTKGSGRLVYSYIGYVSEVEQIGLSSTMDIALVPDVMRLEEVVVVGYGTKRKSELTAAVSTVQIRGIASMPLHGKAAGISVNQIYGSRAGEGVISKGMLSDKALADISFMNSLANASALRNKFSDYAFWQPSLTTDKKGEASFQVTFPDDITAWKTLYVAMGNKKSGSLQSTLNAFKPLAVNLALPRFLIEGDSSFVIGKALNYGTDTLAVSSVFKKNGSTLKTNAFSLLNAHIDSLVVYPETLDTLKIAYQVSEPKGFKDGEERTIPVFPQGVLETEGLFTTLDKDTTIQIIVPETYKQGKVYVESNVLQVFRNEALRVHNYGYLCNEQAASKLKCLLAEKTICAYLGEKFKYNQDIKKLIKRLNYSRSVNNLWGWWKDTPVSMWISLHVLDALLQAKNNGFDVDLKEQQIASYLNTMYRTYSPEDKIKVLNIQHQLGVNKRIELEVILLLKDSSLSFPSRLEAMELFQKTGGKLKIDSLLQQKRETMFGNYYWKADSFDIAAGQIATTLAMYRVIRNDSLHLQLLPKIRNYIFEERKDGYWRNTYESARIIETILPDMLVNKNKLSNPEILFTLNGADSLIKKFPYMAKTKAGDKITISKKGDFPVYLTSYMQHWNSSPIPVQKGFEVNSHFEGYSNNLKAGVPVKLYVTVKVLKKASYIMIEVPIPAGCSYEEKSQGNWNEVHREYFKEKVSIFCHVLQPGDYTFEVELLPRYNGRYLLNPAKAEMMYFPVFFGRNQIRKVSIE